MKALFTIEYKTVWGENLFLVSGGKRFPMIYSAPGIWSLSLKRADEKMLSDYYYIVVKDGIVIRREWDSHHRTPEKGEEDFRDAWIDCPSDANQFARRHTAHFFDKAFFRGAGTAIPVFSLRSANDFGIGEFYDLKQMVDWAVSTGQTVIQLLPINDTTNSKTWEDSYPYNPISSFALHPQYISLKAAGVRADAKYLELQKELNALPDVDYERVNALKHKYLRQLFKSSKGRKIISGPEYASFYNDNRDWLLSYAVFCALRDRNGSCDFSSWGEYSRYSNARVNDFYYANKEEVDYHCFVQYLLDAQLKDVCAYARSKAVAFKGDLPIGISRTSVEAWRYPKLFNMDSQCGAPPDAFASDGQNWGFPTYNWHAMALDDYSWWRTRLGKMAEYFDAFRLDHILGFFRIWEIPVPNKSGLMGHFSPSLPYNEGEIYSRGLPTAGLFVEDPRKKCFWHPQINAKDSDTYKTLSENQKWQFDQLYEDFFYHRNNEYWKAGAMLKFPPLLGCTGMLACGEDLGMIPSCVPEVMSQLKILSLEVQRMPKRLGEHFADTTQYPYYSVCTTSTHDMTPLRAWWEEEDKDLISEYYHSVLAREGDVPSVCPSDVCAQIIDMHLKSPSMLAILPLQDWLAMDQTLRFPRADKERINLPSESRHYWRYRMHISLEDLNSAKEFNDRIKQMIADADR